MELQKEKSWPTYLPKTLIYNYGEKPLHEYLSQHAKEHPTKIAYIYYGNEITWAQLDDETNRMAQFLRNQGVTKGDRIGLFMQNCPQYIIGHYAIQKLAGVVVPLNPMYKEAELKYFINEVEIKAIICSQELYGRISEIKQEIPSVNVIVTTHYADYAPNEPTLPIPDELKVAKQQLTNTFDFLDVVKKTPPLLVSEPIDLWEDVGLMVFTSGTTGRPKAAMLTYGNALFKTAAASQALEFNEHARTVVIPPFCHIGGMVVGVNNPIYSRCHSVLLTRFDTEAAISAVEQYKVNIWYTLAPMNVAILNHPGIEERNLSSLKINFATSFGIPVNEELARQWNELTDGCLLFEATYGLSETHDVDTFMPKDKIKYGSCGIPTYETEMKIIDLETKKELASGKQGEIVIKSRGIFKGYYHRPEDTAEVIKDGWIYTGDIGSLDEDGYLFLHGRVKELIKSSGYSVFPEDVEALLERHEAVLQVAVIGVPDSKRGESVKAFIVLKPEYRGKISEAEFIEWSKKKLSAYKYPRAVEFREHLPQAISGKVLRRLLMEEKLS